MYIPGVLVLLPCAQQIALALGNSATSAQTLSCVAVLGKVIVRYGTKMVPFYNVCIG